MQNPHNLSHKNLSSSLFNITTKDKEGIDIKYNIHEVKELSLTVTIANYICPGPVLDLYRTSPHFEKVG